MAVGFGPQHHAFWQAAAFPQRESDSSLTLAVAIGVRGVDEVDRAIPERAQRGQGTLLGHAVVERLWHITQRCSADAQGSDLQACRAEVAHVSVHGGAVSSNTRWLTNSWCGWKASTSAFPAYT